MYKKPVIVLLTFAFVAIGLLIAWYFWYYYGDRKAAKRRFREQIGTYYLDIKKTKLGTYSVDAALYQKLRITFKSDSTFSTNMQVPFLYDSTGKWESGGGGLEDWNWLNYKSNTNIRTQFDQCCLPDSTFYLNSPTPQEGQESIQRIYFKKLSY